MATIVREYRSGAAVSTLAARFSVTVKTIYRWLKAKKVKKRTSKGCTGKLSEAEIAEIVHAYKSGSAESLLAARFAVSNQTIRYWLKIKKVALRKTPPRFSKARIATFVRLYKSRLAVPQIAERFNVSSTTISYWLKNEKVYIAMPPRLREDQVAEIVSLYKSGVSTPLLATRFNVSTAAISRWLRIHKVITRAKAKPRLVSYDILRVDYLSGLTQAQVAEKHDVSVPTVCRALKLGGVIVRPRLRGSAHHGWKGGRHVSPDQYMILDGKREHRTIMEQLLGRSLHFWECVHHVDDDKLNNAPDNLAVLPNREHTRFHSVLRAHGLPISFETLQRLCRLESPYCYRFTITDARNSGLGQGRYHETRDADRVKCCVKGCARQRYARKLCSMHWQRKRARDRGFWQGANGKRLVFHGKFTRTKRAAAKS